MNMNLSIGIKCVAAFVSCLLLQGTLDAKSSSSQFLYPGRSCSLQHRQRTAFSRVSSMQIVVNVIVSKHPYLF